MASQAWALRRMISTYNAITRRPHLPRERALRQIMAEQGLGVEVDPPIPSAGRATNSDDDDSSDDADHGDDSDPESGSTDHGSSRPGSDDEDSDVFVEDLDAASTLQEVSGSFSVWNYRYL